MQKVPGAQSLKVLVADDNEDLAECLTLLLQIQGYAVEVAYYGRAAVQLAISFQPDVALLDIGMPHLDGYGAARQIRQHLGSDVLLIAVTALGSASDRQAAFDAGFNHHVAKPVTMETIGKLLAELAASKTRRAD